MNPDMARELLAAWERKVAGREPTEGEAQIMRRYRLIAEGFDPKVFDGPGDLEDDL